MEDLYGYVSKRKEQIETEKDELTDKIQSLNIKLKELEEKIETITNSVDSTYAVFSPRVDSAFFDRKELNRLVNRKKEITEELEGYNEQIDILNDDLNQVNGLLYGVTADGENFIDPNLFTDDNSSSFDLDGVKIIEQQESEKKYYSSFISDELVPNLNSTIFKIDYCNKLLDKTDVKQAQSELINITKDIRTYIEGLSSVINELNPYYTNEGEAFDKHLEKYVDDLRTRSAAVIHLSVRGEVYELPKVMTLSLYRMINEAIKNSNAHGNANNIYVTLSYLKDSIKLIIKDDGAGFTPNELATIGNNDSIDHFHGLSLMKQRTYLLAGEFDITSTLGKGTTVTIHLPIA